MAGRISMGARREVVSAVAERYRPAKRAEKGRILDELCATTGWHRKHAVRALRQRETVMPGEVGASRERRRRYGATIKDALTALWEASDRVCGKRLKVMIPTLLPALERNGRLTLDEADRARVLAISAATIDRLLGGVRVAASGGAKVIKRYHVPSTPCKRALVHPKLAAAVKKRLREQYRTLDPVALLAEIRAAQEELGNRVDRRAGDARGQQPAGKDTTPQPVQSSTPDAVAFAKTLGTTVEAGDPRATHRRPKRPYKTRVRMPSKLDPHVVTIEYWLAAEPQLTALAIVGRLIEKHPEQFGMRQHSIVQPLLKALRKKAAEKLIAQKPPCAATIATPSPGPVDGSGYIGPDPPTAPPVEPASTAMRLIRSVDVGSSAPTVLSW
jgi:hypothetical protein